jgi:hypothetical protein
MTWFVKGRDADGTVHPVLVDDSTKVPEIFHEHRIRGRETWIEDTVGKRVAPSEFGIRDET